MYSNRRHSGFALFELLCTLAILGTLTVFFVNTNKEKKAVNDAKDTATSIHMYLDQVRMIDPTVQYLELDGHPALSPDDQAVIDDELANGMLSVPDELYTRLIKDLFGDDMRTQWGAEIKFRTEIHEHTIQFAPPINDRACISMVNDLLKSPVYSIGYTLRESPETRVYRTMDNDPLEVLNICSGKDITVNYCNHLNDRTCESVPVGP